MAKFDILADWMGTGIFHRDARPADAINLYGAQADHLHDMRRSAAGTGGALSIVDDFAVPLIFSDKTGMGHSFLRWTTGTDAICWMNVGYDGAFDLAAQPAGDYTVVLWARLESGSSASQCRAELIRFDGGSILALGAAATLTTAWQRFTATGALPATDELILRFARVAGATDNIKIYIAGAMLVAGGTGPSAFNAGGPSRYDNLSAWTKTASWSFGFQQPYRHVADLGRGGFALDNESTIFSPELGTSPLLGALTAMRRLRVYAYDDPVLVDKVLMWSGFVSAIKPTAGMDALPECRLEAVDIRALASGRTVRLPVQVNQRARAIAETIDDSLDLPTELVAPGDPGGPGAYDFEEIYPYALDAAGSDDMDAVRAMTDCAGAMQAKIAYDARNPAAPFIWKFPTDLTSSDTLIDLDPSRFQSVAYQFGASLVNESTVVARKRKVSAATDKILYDAGETIALEPHETQTLRARYKDIDLEDDRTVSGLDVYVDVTADPGVTVNIVDEFGNGCEIEIGNTTGAPKSITTLRVRGKKLTAWGETEHRATNAESLALHGSRAELLDYRLPANRKLAQSTAEYRVERFGTAFGEFTAVTLKTIDGDDALREAMLKANLFDAVWIEDADQAGHSGYYTIVGMEHRLDSGLGGQDGAIGGYTVVWILEKQYPFAIADDAQFGKLDAGNVLAFY